MAQVINTNIASLTAQRNLAASQKDAATAMQRLSSGLRINSAKDDAAGLAIASRLTSQINGINQAVRNANDAVSVVQIAEGALSESTSILQRMRELAVQSANASNSSADRTSLQSEVTQLSAELDRIANTTSFGATKLMNGAFASKTFQVGAQVGETFNLSISSARSSDMGTTYTVAGLMTNLEKATAGTTVAGANTIAAQNLTFNVDGQNTTIAVAADSDAKQIAADISSQVGGLTGSASTTATVQFTNDAAQGGATDTYTINGNTLTVDMTNATLGATTGIVKATALETAINANAALSAALTVSRTDDTITLTDADGDNIAFTIGSGNTADASDITFDSGGQGDNVALTEDGNNVGVAVGTISLTGSADVTYTVYSDTDTLVADSSSASAPDTTSSVTQTSSRVSTVDISTVTGANTALAIIDSAITTVDSQRATLGAAANRLDSVISNLSNVAENSQAARSRIMDADFASETAALAKNQILQQAGISVLAQANAQPQNVLALLQ